MSLFTKHSAAPIIGLFTSISSLICCALPALLVSLGMGAALAGLAANFPFLISFTEHKVSVFIITGLIILVALSIHLYSRKLPCPLDPIQAKWCSRFRKIGTITLIVSIIIYLTGAFFAFLAADLLI